MPIEAKLRIPLSRHDFTHRGHLVDRFLGSVESPVVVVTGPPGYGKTVAVSQWAQEDARPFAWLSVDQGDNDLEVFVTYVLLALQRVERIEPALLRCLTEAQWSTGAVTACLAEVIRTRRLPFVLVLDGLDALTARDIWEAITLIAGNVPQGSQLVLVARGSLPLAGDRRVGRPLEFSMNDLRFSHPEAVALLESAGTRIGNRDVDQLLDRTEGWAAGMYLAMLALSATREERGPVDVALAEDSPLAEYIRDEVLEELTADDQQFILRCSILEAMCAPLCDAVLVTAGSDAALQRLAELDVLVPTDEQSEWLRLRRPCVDAFRAELRLREPQLVTSLHSRASRWLAEADFVEDAVEHAIAAGEVDRSARLIWQVAPSCLETGRVGLLESWLDRFTPTTVAGNAKLALTAAWCALHRGHAAEHWVAAAERGRYDAGQKGEAESVASGIALLHAVICRNGVEQMAADVQLATGLQSDDDPWKWVAELLAGVCALLTGHVAEASSRLETVERVSGARNRHETRALALAELAVIAIDEDDWRSAQELTEKATALIREQRLDAVPLLAPVFCVAALVEAVQGSAEQATLLVQQGLRLLALVVNPPAWAGTQCREVLARCQLVLGETASARVLLSEAQGQSAEIRDTVLATRLEQTWGLVAKVPLDVGLGASTLTSAELRILGFLPTHLSFEEIGRRLFVSRNTVKTQAVAAYRKLGVNSRSEAVERAYELGLIREPPV